MRVTEFFGVGAVDGSRLNEFMQGESGRVIPRHAVDVDKKLLPFKGHVKVCISDFGFRIFDSFRDPGNFY